MLTVTTRLVYNAAPALAKRTPGACDKAVLEGAAVVVRRMQEDVHVITGALRASVGVVGPGTDTYASAQAEAQGLRPNVQPLAAPERPKGHAAVVAVGMPYGIVEEYGNTYRPGHPFWSPAVEEAREAFPGLVAAAVTRAARAAGVR